ncbi:predicted protein [Streptomyces viridochromogenes DSM 40736]|uniref:Predicted protein n=1 Tax=Streptomyces viridochromogenes (strain DSM 40736 / JCM 4977 / BCRC 1201 / Tue 494) TaxID=591159 RepID=D9X7M6_STRVT|nr:DUF6223 family protein [Streptomyces viridochromogenes]EFL29922.1 predicted protein [Streptomyces viridochromogenes DSM 40736]
MSATDVLMVAAEGGAIGDGRTGAVLALCVGLAGVALGWLALARVAGRIRTGNARTGAMAAMAVGLTGTALAALHLATSSGGPGTGNGMVGAVVAIPLGFTAVALGRQALARSRRTEWTAEDCEDARELGSAP